MRWHESKPLLRSGESARWRQARPNGHGQGSRPWLEGAGRQGVVVRLERVVGWIVGRCGRLRRLARMTVCECRVRAVGEEGVRLGAQELRPGGADPPRRRPEPRAPQHVGHRRGRDSYSELEQFALDPHVAPVGVLPSETDDQAARLGWQRRTTGSTTSPPSPKQRPVPAAKRPRTHCEARPPLRREQPARGRQERPVDARVTRPLPSPPEDRELVSQDHDLEISLATAPDEQPEQPAQKPVQQTSRHDTQSEPERPQSPRQPDPWGPSFFTPQGSARSARRGG
jgi:hypothetical protein